MYGRAIVNPFSDFKEPPCIPDSLALASYKLCAKSRGVFSTGGSGVGFVTLNPFTGFVGDTASNSSGIDYPVVFTTVAYARNDMSIAPGTLTEIQAQGLGVADTNSSLLSSMFDGHDQQQVRLVGAGLKIRYIGSNFRNQGRIVIARSPGNAVFPAYTTASNLLSFNTNRTAAVSRREEYVYYVPDSPILLTYATKPFWGPATGGADRRSLVMYIDGGDITVPQSWEFEAVMHYEVIGANLPQTFSSSDPAGMGSVIAAASGRVPTAPPTYEENSLWQKVAQAFDKETTRVIETTVRAGVATAAIAGAQYLRRGTVPMVMGTPRVEDV